MLANGTLLLAAALAAAPGPTATWIGQDGHDFVGPSTEVKPSDVQDIHVVLDGLPAAKEVAHLVVTGYGGDEWQYRGKWGPWGAHLERAPHAGRADLYLEPSRVETGRSFTVAIRYDDGSGAEFHFRGKKARPDLRMASAAVGASWGGQGPDDWTGRGPAVGPDGLQDAKLALVRLSPKSEVKSLAIEGPVDARWCYGVNPAGDSNAELIRDPKDPTRAVLFFQPDRDLRGQRLALKVLYAQGQADSATVVAGATEPDRPMPEVRAPRPIAHAIRARWHGQDGSPGAGPGDVHIALENLPARRDLVAAALSDAVRATWAYRRRPGDRSALFPVDGEEPLAFRQQTDPARADLFFAPIRDESGRTLTLRLVFADGTWAVVRIPGGVCDVLKRVPEVAGDAVEARPGDDLEALAARHRTVRLKAGTYRLAKPLALTTTVSILGEPGSTLLFEQGADQPPWPAAITVCRGRTTLDGFAVRFAGPVRWKADVAWGPAVIGMVEPPVPDPRLGLTFAHLDLEAPPAADPSGWEDAPRLLRLVGARSGRVADNRLRGGPVEFFGGPWEVVGNEFPGTSPGTVSPGVFCAHDPHDLVLKGNHARPVGPAGKTWRFLVLTGSGSDDRIEENVVEEIGPRDDDTIPPANAPEIVLTESYRLAFEGKPAAISPDGRVVHLGAGRPLGPSPRSGSVVAVLAGKATGHWRRIAQVLGPESFLLDEPLPPGADRISVATGFVDETFARNTVDARGGSKAADLILGGNHFGTKVVDNRLLGAGDAFQITAFATEAPGIWGWSHAPFLGALIAGNTIEDAERGGTVGVQHSEHIKSGRGRTYFTATLRDNTIKWTAEFLRQRRDRGEKALPPGLTVGFPPPSDPVEQILKVEGNALDAPAGLPPTATLRVHAAVVNGRRTVDQSFGLKSVSPSGSAARGAPSRKSGDRR